MSDLFWPGDERAGELMSQRALIEAMIRVEQAWLGALVQAGLAPPDSRMGTRPVLDDDALDRIARSAESAGNPAVPLVGLLRGALPQACARWLHEGLTSQDVVDTALVLVVRDVLDRIGRELDEQLGAVAALAERHAGTPMIGRTLTQHAVPTTFGAVAAAWLDGLADAAEQIAGARERLPAQFGGAVGTLAATAESARLRGLPEPAGVAAEVARLAARSLGLPGARPWHTTRTPLTRVADALVTATDTWGHIAADVATLARSEIRELAEPAHSGRGGSSTMPHKQNPVLSVLIRRAALTAPALASTMHLAAATAEGQRPDGAWHAEWATMRTLGRRAAVAASQATELLAGLHVDEDRMLATLDAAGTDVLAERRRTAALVDAAFDPDPATYLGISGGLAADAVARARRREERS